MVEYIGCRECNSLYCKGCNLKNLETMLRNGKFDCIMNENRCINTAADVAPVVHGRWDDSGRYTFPNGATAVRCTICGCALNEREYHLYDWNYCPICGAKMDECNEPEN